MGLLDGLKVRRNPIFFATGKKKQRRPYFPVKTGWLIVILIMVYKLGTPGKTNMSPENWWLEDVYPIEVFPIEIVPF